MKKSIILLIAAAFGAGTIFTGCSDDDFGKSEIYAPFLPENAFDRWLKTNYLEPYNIVFQYRFKDVLGDMDYNLAPVQYDQGIMMAKLTLHLTLQAYDEVTGSQQFIRQNFPKIVHLIGSAAYNSNNSVVLGVAEGGKMMTLYEGNEVAERMENRDMVTLNERYFKTMHHEFGHILHQTKPYPVAFNNVNGDKYVGDACFETYPTDQSARLDGFITPYSATSADEDFVENISLYVTSTAEEWASYIAQGGDNTPILERKIEIVRAYMQDTWGIDIDKLRKIVLRRQSEIWDLDFSIEEE